MRWVDQKLDREALLGMVRLSENVQIIDCGPYPRAGLQPAPCDRRIRYRDAHGLPAVPSVSLRGKRRQRINFGPWPCLAFRRRSLGQGCMRVAWPASRGCSERNRHGSSDGPVHSGDVGAAARAGPRLTSISRRCFERNLLGALRDRSRTGAQGRDQPRVLSHQLDSGGAMFGRPAAPHAAVAARHVRNASSLRMRSVRRDVRWRWTLNVL
jgi:hypothetical protein